MDCRGGGRATQSISVLVQILGCYGGISNTGPNVSMLPVMGLLGSSMRVTALYKVPAATPSMVRFLSRPLSLLVAS